MLYRIALTVLIAVAVALSASAQAATIGWWRMGDSDLGAVGGGAIATTVSEVNSAALDAASVNSPLYGSDVPGKFIFSGISGPGRTNALALDVSGSNARVRVPNSSLLNVGGSGLGQAGDFTYEFFIKLIAEPSSYTAYARRMLDNDLFWQVDFSHGGVQGVV